MALGNETGTEPRTARLEVNEQPACDEYGGRWRAGAATGAVADPAQWPYGGGIIVQAEVPNGSMNFYAVALVKRDRENDLFPIFALEDRRERSA